MEEANIQHNNNRKKRTALIVLAIIVTIGIVAAFFYVRYISTHISTDDAFIEGSIFTISPKIPGTVYKVYVDDNQPVKRGDLLVEIDPIDYQVKVEEKWTELNAEEAKIEEIESNITVAIKRLSELQAAEKSAEADLALQNARLNQAEIDRKRAKNLYSKGAIPKETYERAETAYKLVQAQVTAATENLKQAKRAVETHEAVIQQARSRKSVQMSFIKQQEAELRTAQLRFGYTKIYSPTDGYVTKKSIESGNEVTSGQPLMAVVSLEDVHVIANYKETQLEKVKPGQEVEIEVDMYPDRTFHGTVQSIMAGTGSAFSLFPPENATGNYVKVVQRIPVKIVFDEDMNKEHILRIGMSVVPTILIKDE